MNEMIRDKLIEAAKQHKIIYYSEVGELLNFSMDNPHHRTELGRILGEISTEEHQKGLPLLSALVVHKENLLPGEGFFKLARELGKQKSDEDNDSFYTKELKEVFERSVANR